MFNYMVFVDGVAIEEIFADNTVAAKSLAEEIWPNMEVSVSRTYASFADFE